MIAASLGAVILACTAICCVVTVIVMVLDRRDR